MSYIALARKWRPNNFDQLVGQEHVTRILINSLKRQRLHHAYIFTGTRGVGKTSIARLFAKAINCENGISADPCLICPTCIAIENGNHVDLIEVDAASKTRVEDTRELLDNVQYAPTRSRFKLYLIDEVHMLSQHSFNALLKTLEEPPEHVKFLLATTDSQKLPVTVLSRCLQFNLKHIEPAIISKQLQTILNEEHISFEPKALELLSVAAKGSMRDALSLLDQAIASVENELQTKDIQLLLGYTQNNYALQVLLAIANNNPCKLLDLSRQIAVEGSHFNYVTDEIITILHKLCIHQCAPEFSPLENQEQSIIQLSQALSPEDVQLLYQISIKNKNEIALAPTMAIGFEMMLLRMYVFKPSAPAKIPVISYQESHSQTPDLIAINNSSNVTASTKEIIENSKKPQETQKSTTPALVINNSWTSIIDSLNLSGLALNAAQNTEFVSKSNSNIILKITKSHKSVFTKMVQQNIEKALSNYYTEEINIVIEEHDEAVNTPAIKMQEDKQANIENAESSLKNDLFFQQLQDEFSAEVVKNSITSIEDDL